MNRIRTPKPPRSCAAATARAAVLFALFLVLPARVLAIDSALLRSLILPGAGQAQQGHYTRAAIFAGSAVFSGVGAAITQVHYNQAVDRYRQEKRKYFGYQAQLDRGELVQYEDLQRTYSQMKNARDQAADRYVWRTILVASFIATYALNVVDVVLSSPSVAEHTEPISLEWSEERVLLLRTFRF